MTVKTYVYNGTEYEMTGRKAEKKLYSGKKRELFEIRPVGMDDTQTTYNKWATMDELFEVLE
jgi:hypothetical protein